MTMRLDNRLRTRADAAADADPREGQGAEVISLATRTVMPAVTQRKPRAAKAGGNG